MGPGRPDPNPKCETRNPQCAMRTPGSQNRVGNVTSEMRNVRREGQRPYSKCAIHRDIAVTSSAMRNGRCEVWRTESCMECGIRGPGRTGVSGMSNAWSAQRPMRCECDVTVPGRQIHVVTVRPRAHASVPASAMANADWTFVVHMWCWDCGSPDRNL